MFFFVSQIWIILVDFLLLSTLLSFIINILVSVMYDIKLGYQLQCTNSLITVVISSVLFYSRSRISQAFTSQVCFILVKLQPHICDLSSHKNQSFPFYLLRPNNCHSIVT